MMVAGAWNCNQIMDDEQFLTMLQLIDGALPTGGFAHSLGLESAVKHKLVTDKGSLGNFVISVLENAGSFSLPFVNEAHKKCDAHDELVLIDRLCDVCLSNHVSHRASVRQGRALLEVAKQTFHHKNITTLHDVLDHSHHPVVFGAVCGCLGFGHSVTKMLFMFGVVRSIMAASVRLGVLGPMEAQSIQHNLQENIPDIINRHSWRTVADACVRNPVVDIIQNAQDTLFAKLFYT